MRIVDGEDDVPLEIFRLAGLGVGDFLDLGGQTCGHLIGIGDADAAKRSVLTVSQHGIEHHGLSGAGRARHGGEHVAFLQRQPQSLVAGPLRRSQRRRVGGRLGRC